MNDKPIITSTAISLMLWVIIAYSGYMWLKPAAVCTASEQTCNEYMH